MAKPRKIDWTLWAHLLSGAVTSVHHHRASLRMHGRYFVLKGPTGEHLLSSAETDDKRLNAHWQQFATVNA